MGLLDDLLFSGVIDGIMKNKKKTKDDWSFGNNTWDKKYPNAFDDDFGADYEDNGFNKFDDEDGY